MIYFGNQKIREIQFGSQKINEAYYGSRPIFNINSIKPPILLTDGTLRITETRSVIRLDDWTLRIT